MKEINIFIENQSENTTSLINQMKKHFNPKEVNKLGPNCLVLKEGVFVDWKYLLELIQLNAGKNLKFNFLESYLENGIELVRYIDSGISYFFETDAAEVELPIVKYEQEITKQNPVLFLDRDGIINVDHGYVHIFSEIDIFDDMIEVIKAANHLSIPVVITTNQAGIARGLYTHKEVDLFHRELKSYLLERGAHIDHIEISPFHEKSGNPPWNRESLLRKPNPGMHLKGWARVQGTVAGSLMLGDKESDRISISGLETYLIDDGYKIESGENVFDSRTQLCSESVRYLNKMLDFS
ncbi:hypothetical protein A9Q84_06165 [Halobacteriovorax marinus]|uniref:D,D-heptose 1,7-bisphosphate phosphatase n=1 Tax=Halobacteriovorax marinus TaxID=97084 RepID=A0A1Y5FF60_9BACT|nr:hypothetical protein A9Q84_06165 [Halobacteriovorax marinus]